jgi:hypothetical protein
VSTIRLDARRAPVVSDADTAFREDFLLLVARIGLSRDEAAMLVEASSGQPFDACRPPELLPILDVLLALAERTAHTSSEPPCGA